MGESKASAPLSGTATPLIERDADLARIAGAIAQVAGGEGALAFVRGPAGIGKTQLLAASMRLANESGLAVLSGRGSELESEFAHGLVRQLLDRFVHTLDRPVRDRVLVGPALHAANAILSVDPSQARATVGDSEFAAMHGLYWLVANLAAERPLMLVVDDAHWADEASLRFVSYLANRLAGVAVLVVVAARSDDPSAATELLEALVAAADTVVQPAALTPGGSARLVRRDIYGATDAFVAACHWCSGGNPFLLHELLKAITADGIAGDDAGAGLLRRIGPRSVSRAVFLRLARLPAGAAAFARAVAVLGDRVELRDAAALAAISLERAADLSDALAVAGVLLPSMPLCFQHPMILEAVAGDLGPGERTRMHARAAEQLHERGAAAEQVAAHLSGAGPIGQRWAADVLRRVADTALARGAPDVARRHLLRALREEHTSETRAVVLTELGTAQMLCIDDPAAVIEHVREACRLTADASLRARATITLARVLTAVGDIQGAADALEQALGGSQDLAPADRLRLEAELGSMGLLNLSLMPRVRDRLAAFGAVAGDSVEELLLLCNVAAFSWLSAPAAETVALARRALAGDRLLVSVGPDAIMIWQAVFALCCAEDVPAARVACDAGLAEARRRGSMFGFIAGCAFAALAAMRAGDVRACEAHARAGLDLMDFPPYAGASLCAHLARALIERGALDEAELALEQGWVGPELPVLVHLNGGFHARGILRAAQGRDEDAVADLTEFGAREAQCGVANAATPWRVDAARAHLRMGHADEAAQLLDEHETIAAGWGAPGPIGIGLQGRAALTAGPEQVAMLERARELLAESPRRLDEARLLLDLGQALRRAGRRREAERRLGEAVALARGCGAIALATKANDELGVLSTRPRRLQFSGVESLTASERRIAMLAAEGQSNPEIAQALFVTRKTVENHLGRIYIKLSISSRKQLAAAFGEQAIVAGDAELEAPAQRA